MKIDWKTCRRVGISAFLLFLAIYYWQTAASLISLFLGACVPLFLGGAIAYVIGILMTFFEKHYFPNSTAKAVTKSRRAVCMLASVLAVILAGTFVVKLVVPEFISCINALVRRAPAVVNRLLSNPNIREMVPADLMQRISSLNWNEAASRVGQVLLSGFTGAASAVSSVFSGIVTALFAIIFAVYLLLDKDTLKRQCLRLLDNYLRPDWKDKTLYGLKLLNDSFHHFVVGQCTEAVILGVLCIAGLSLFRFPYATMIGTLVGVTALIPVAGAYIGACVGAFMILSVSAQQALWFLVFIVALQQLEGNLIYPKVVGSSIGLPGIFVLAAVTIGGAMFGVLGMLIGVPLIAAIYQAIRADMARREAEKYVLPEEYDEH